MTDQHCPGFESNKSLKSITVKCPECPKELEVFTDEMDKKVKCPECGIMVDPKTATVV